MDANQAARQAAALHAKIDGLEQDIEKLEEKLETISVKMYKHFAESQVDSLRLAQLIEDVNALQSSIRYASRTTAVIVATALFGAFFMIISSGANVM
jgi:outer membrane murein-binding lipoprotein Lpp